MRLSGWVLPLAMMVSLSPASFGQTSDWAILRQLVPGQKVKVETSDGKSHVGKIESTTDDALQVGKDQLQKQDVQRVWIWNSGHHGRNTLIGLGAGAAVGVVFGAASCGRDSIVSRGECVAVGAPLFGGIGAGIGALLPSHGGWREVYRSKLP